MSSEFDVEPIPGLPERPPQGEVILWQGGPDWRVLARQVFHIRAVAFYFAALILWQFASNTHDGGTLTEALVPSAMLIGFALLSMALLCALAWAMARATVYTLTNRRVVIRIGVALPVTFNLPFAKIEAASLKAGSDGTGDIALTLVPGERLAYLVLWPHARPWQLKQPQPTLRCIPDAAAVAAMLAQAFTQAHPGRITAQASSERPARAAPSLSPVAG
jgi:hypothetical protein